MNNKLKNGMNDYKLIQPTESKAYLVMFSNGFRENYEWFEVVHFQHKCKKWKRLNHLAIGWSELPTTER